MVSERRGFARLLRSQPTRAEDILWRSLRGSRLLGAKFRRQVPFDRFVVDFTCHAAKLAIELDGKQHDWFADYDAERTRILETRGISVIRFANAEVEGDLDSVLERIRDALGRLFNDGAGPSPLPLSRTGEGSRAFLRGQVRMSSFEVCEPIRNSPYDAPSEHWLLKFGEPPRPRRNPRPRRRGPKPRVEIWGLSNVSP